MRLVRAEGLHQQAALLIGVGPIASAKTAKWLRANVPGVHIPDAIVARLEGAADAREEGRRIAIELIRAIRGIAGIAGIHLMAHRQERLLPSIIDESGVFAGRAPMFCPPQPHSPPQPRPPDEPPPMIASPPQRPTVVISCKVLEDLLGKRLPPASPPSGST